MKIKFLALLFALTTVVATAQNNSAKSNITTNLSDQGLRGITDAKLIATLNAIVDWAGSPASKRLTLTQARALSTDYPNIIYITTATAGLFTLDETDNTTADDGVNTIVTTANNKRYKRVTGSIASISGLQAALDLKANLSSPTFTGTVGGITKSMVGLANVDNTSDANKPVSTAQQTALNLKLNLSGGTLTGGLNGTAATFSGKVIASDTIRSIVALKSKAFYQYERIDASNTDEYSWSFVNNGAGAGQSLKLAYSSQRTSGGTFNPNVLYITDGKIGVMKTGATKTLDIFGTLGVSGDITATGALNSSGTFSTSGQSAFNITPTLTNSSGIGYNSILRSTVNQSGSASHTELLVSPYYQANGSGTLNLLDIGTSNAGGTHTSKFSVNSAGVIKANNYTGYLYANGSGPISASQYIPSSSISGTANSLAVFNPGGGLSTSISLTWDGTSVGVTAGLNVTGLVNVTGKSISSDTIRSDVGLKSKAIYQYSRLDASNVDSYDWTLVSNGAGAGQSLKLAYSSQRTSGGTFNPNVLYITDGKIGVMKTGPNYTMDVTGSLGVSSNIGIGTTTSNVGYNLKAAANITGGTSNTSHGIESSGTIQSDVTTLSSYFRTVASQASGFTTTTVNHYSATQGTYSGTVTSQMGFLAGSSLTGATNNYGFYGNIALGTNRYNLYMNGTADNYINGRVGLGSTALSDRILHIGLSLGGAPTAYGIMTNATVQSNVTSTAYYNFSQLNTQAASYTLSNAIHYAAVQGVIGAGSTVGTQVGFSVSSSLTGATNNYGFRGQLNSASNVYNLYMDGTANNYLKGSLGIDATTTTSKLQVVGLATYADNAAATTAGLTAGAFYRTSTGQVMVVY